jgi:thioredoxin 1
MTKFVTDKTFDAEVISSGIPVVVDFTANWCMPCKAMSPIVDKVASELESSVKVVKVDVDDSPDTAKSFSIRGIPTFIFFKEGKEVDRWMGANKNEASFKEKINSLLTKE